MIRFPNAKINLGLNIVNRRTDGYHDIETVFYPITLEDSLEIVPAADGCDTSLTCHGRHVDCPMEKNLVTKAFRLLQQEFNLPDVEMHLIKHIRRIGRWQQRRFERPNSAQPNIPTRALRRPTRQTRRSTRRRLRFLRLQSPAYGHRHRQYFLSG